MLVYMSSSYETALLNYGDIFQMSICLTQPNKVVEFGILDGFSLQFFADYCAPDCQIEAYDIFDKFVGHHANYDQLTQKFKAYPNIKIRERDFWSDFEAFPDHSIDLLHIDIANTGDTLEYVMTHYLPKIRSGGLILLEGGSTERDNYHWMVKYNKRPIRPYINQLQEQGYQIFVLEKFPSMTILKVK